MVNKAGLADHLRTKSFPMRRPTLIEIEFAF